MATFNNPSDADVAALIARVQGLVIRDAGSTGVLDAWLPELLKLVGCDYGFIGEVQHSARGAPFIDVLALADLAWDDATRERIARQRLDGLALREPDTLPGRVLGTGAVVIVEPAQQPDSASGLPHAPRTLRNFFGMPLRREGEMVGVLCLANRDTAFDVSLQHSLEALGVALGSIVAALRRERERWHDVLALRESEQRFRTSFELAGVGIGHVSLDGELLEVNARLCEILGRPKEVLRRTLMQDITHPDDLPGYLEQLRALLDGQRNELTLEKRYLRPDGSYVWTQVMATLMRDERGHRPHLLFVVEDITERMRLREQQIAAAADERASLATSSFLSRMSHELRTPLNAVLGFSQLLRTEPGGALSDEQRHRAAQIEQAGAHLLRMIDRVLDLSRLDAGNEALASEPVRLGPVIEAALMDLAADAEEAGVTLGYTPPPLALHARADPVRLQQVLAALLSNAIKFNRRAGSVHVLCTVEGDAVRISVSDTGPGLTAKQQAHLFEPFNRLGAERTLAKGTGMGLAIAHKLVTLMNGRIEVETQPGAGAIFSVWLPTSQARPARSGGEVRLNPTALSVLYAEDNELNVELMRQVLQLRPGCVLRVARNGAEAITSALSETPDLLLLDMHLGDMSGFDVVNALERDPVAARVPRIALSSDDQPEHRRAADTRGFFAYLTKPLNVVMFLRCLDEQLAARRTAGGSA
jgi:PAS domain S-box-containing protein